MRFGDLRTLLGESGAAPVVFQLPDGSPVPAHYHVTEVGFVRKEFFDCGGVRRVEQYCALQLWVATDTDHKLQADKLVSILNFTQSVIPDQALEVQVEYQRDSLSVYQIASAQRIFGKIVIQLAPKETACLAPDRCGVQGCC